MNGNYSFIQLAATAYYNALEQAYKSGNQPSYSPLAQIGSVVAQYTPEGYIRTSIQNFSKIQQKSIADIQQEIDDAGLNPDSNGGLDQLA